MSDEKPAAPAAAPKLAAPAPEETIPLDEFCQRHSGEDKRVELLHGFRFDAIRKGSVRDTAKNFRAALDAFASRKV